MCCLKNTVRKPSCSNRVLHKRVLHFHTGKREGGDSDVLSKDAPKQFWSALSPRVCASHKLEPYFLGQGIRSGWARRVLGSVVPGQRYRKNPTGETSENRQQHAPVYALVCCLFGSLMSLAFTTRPGLDATGLWTSEDLSARGRDVSAWLRPSDAAQDEGRARGVAVQRETRGVQMAVLGRRQGRSSQRVVRCEGVGFSWYHSLLALISESVV